jgi:hypothetical protein
MSRAAVAGSGGESRASSSRSSGSRPARSASGNYLQVAHRPLHCLIFLLPLIICYEVGTIYFASDAVQRTEHRIIAFSFLRNFFELFGATGRYLPALTVVFVLLTWHVARNDSWQIRWGAMVGMAIETAIFTFFLLALSIFVVRNVPMMGIDAGVDRRAMLVLCLGAGIYEELIFRLVAFTLLNLFLLDFLKVPKVPAALLIVLIAGVLFAGYHYLGNEAFRLQTFVFRTVAGIYFGILFLTRGFGITAATHALYDVLVVWHSRGA